MNDTRLSYLIDRVAALDSRGGRRMLAMVGPPGSGKSTCAETLRSALVRVGFSAAVIPMDGFHYDDNVLEARGLLPRKGAPETFDVAGLHALLTRLRRNEEAEIAIPVFDRDLEISRNAARIIGRETQVLIVEGNYLLLDRPGWRDLATCFDLTVMFEVDTAELRRRLIGRWQDLEIPASEISARVDENDLPNGLTVLRGSRLADVTIRQGDNNNLQHSA